MTLYQNRYHVETTNIFGIIEQGIMQLNEYGRIFEQCWFDLPNHYSNLILDAFVIMPNHFHGIMIINNTRETVVPVNGGGVVSVVMNRNFIGYNNIFSITRQNGKMIH